MVTSHEAHEYDTEEGNILAWANEIFATKGHNEIIRLSDLTVTGQELKTLIAACDAGSVQHVKAVTGSTALAKSKARENVCACINHLKHKDILTEQADVLKLMDGDRMQLLTIIQALRHYYIHGKKTKLLRHLSAAGDDAKLEGIIKVYSNLWKTKPDEMETIVRPAIKDAQEMVAQLDGSAQGEGGEMLRFMLVKMLEAVGEDADYDLITMNQPNRPDSSSMSSELQDLRAQLRIEEQCIETMKVDALQQAELAKGMEAEKAQRDMAMEKARGEHSAEMEALKKELEAQRITGLEAQRLAALDAQKLAALEVEKIGLGSQVSAMQAQLLETKKHYEQSHSELDAMMQVSLMLPPQSPSIQEWPSAHATCVIGVMVCADETRCSARAAGQRGGQGAESGGADCGPGAGQVGARYQDADAEGRDRGEGGWDWVW